MKSVKAKVDGIVSKSAYSSIVVATSDYAITQTIAVIYAHIYHLRLKLQAALKQE